MNSGDLKMHKYVKISKSNFFTITIFSLHSIFLESNKEKILALCGPVVSALWFNPFTDGKRVGLIPVHPWLLHVCCVVTILCNYPEKWRILLFQHRFISGLLCQACKCDLYVHSINIKFEIIARPISHCQWNF